MNTRAAALALIGAALATPAAAQTPAITITGSITSSQPPSQNIDFPGQPTSVYDGGMEVVLVRFGVAAQTQVQIDVLSFFAFPTFVDGELRLYRDNTAPLGPGTLIASSNQVAIGQDLNGSPWPNDPFLDLTLEAGSYVVAFGSQVLDDAEADARASDGDLQGDGTQSLPITAGQYQIDIYGDGLSRALVTNLTQGTESAFIADAIDGATPGDVLELSAGTFVERAVAVNGGTNLTIRGQGAGVTVIDGRLGDREILSVTGESTLLLEDLTLRGGNRSLDNGGGALRVRSNSFVEVRRCVFENNGRTNSQGAGAVNVQEAEAVFHECVFRNNTIRPGFHGNNMSLLRGGTARLYNSVIESGIDGASSITMSSPATLELVNCTLIDTNGTTYIRARGGAAATAHIVNSAFTETSNPVPFITANGASIQFTRILIPNITGGDNIAGAPTFVDAANGDYRLAPGSLGIDAGDYDAFIAAGGTNGVDAAGELRIVDVLGTPNYTDPFSIDIGAFEAGAEVVNACPQTFGAPFDQYDAFDVQQFLDIGSAGECP
ncbi:MAG: hypothetical protein AAGI30_07670 [Planctomycetota bacterium]